MRFPRAAPFLPSRQKNKGLSVFLKLVRQPDFSSLIATLPGVSCRRSMTTFPGVSFRRKRNVSSISRRDLREISSVCISLFSPLQPCSRFFPGSRSRFSLLTRFHPFWQTSDVCSFFCARSVAGRGGNVYNRGTARKPSSCEEAARPSPDMLFVAADSSSVDRIRLNRRPLRGLL